MAKTSRGAWGLTAVLAVVLVLAPVGRAAMFVRDAKWGCLRLLKPSQWGFRRVVSDATSVDRTRPRMVSVECIDVGFVRAVRLE